ncbi:ABC-2 type transporter-domain-containing protein [Limtongia smithiae]|uniref:ABC-2 type transporter-domain-containing protein n=1 Tax=Limtongia smithiae TaxID=1125753 RepID=UPI0034CFC159
MTVPAASSSDSFKDGSASLGDAESQSDDHVHAMERQDLHRIITEGQDQLDRLVRVLSTRSAAHAEEDLSPEDFQLERVLRRTMQMSESEGILTRSTSALFRGLTTVGVDMGTKALVTVADILAGPFRIGQIFKAKKKQTRNLIEDMDGLVRAGEMLLVLGRPGSGCSTFLKTVAGEIDAYEEVLGNITYNGVDQKTIKQNFKGDILYSPELDVHFPILNVDETLSFAADIKAPRIRAGNVSRKEYVNDLRDVLATVFGLRHTYNTKVGNDYIRGVSGGERKRVSLAEVMASRANLVCWDNSTRGLDASTALEYAQTLRTSTNLLNNTALVAIYQAGENIYTLFDKVTVLYLGRQIYFGPVGEARAYFEEMGYVCQARQTTPEFLTSITDPSGRFVREGFAGRVPVTADQFAEYWKKSPQHAKLIAEMDAYEATLAPAEALSYMQQSIKQERPKHGKRKNSPYTLSFLMQLKILVRRGFQRQKGDKPFLISSLVSAIAQSLLVGSLFYDIPDSYDGSFSRGGLLFFAMLFFTVQSVAEMAMLYPQRLIVEKQKRFGFYHPAAEAMSYIVTSMPIKVASIIVFALIFYFLSNLLRTAGQFFLFLLFVFTITFTMTTFFQMISSFSPTLDVANAIAGLMLMIVLVYAGFFIPSPLMHPWFGWLQWLNPIHYGFEAILANDMHGRKMDCTAELIPYGEGYDNQSLSHRVCAATGSKPGYTYVLGDDYISDSFSFTFSHVWRNFGILIGFAIFFVAMYALGTEFTSPAGSKGDVLVFLRGHGPERLPTEEELAEKDKEEISAEAAEAMKMNEIFTWQHLNYTVTLDNGVDRQLLMDVQGYTKPGTLTALMGESGAGKTTLLNNLAQRINVGVISGDVLVDGKPLTSDFKRRTGYVQQQDIHVAESTVRESLRFAAELRQPSSVSKEEKYEHVERVIDMLGMNQYAEAVVGILGEGLNVEQRKKLSIGVELAAKPSLLLFLDEPTSGLDSQSAWAVVQLLRKLANAGQSILCTIHQPSATLFEQFDKLLLLKKGGQTVYFGDIGKNSATMIDYFESHGAPKCGDDENPAEYILNCIGAGATAATDRDWYDIWRTSDNFVKTSQEVDELVNELRDKPVRNVSKELSGTFAATWPVQVFVVTRRLFQQYWRDPAYMMAKLTLMLSSGLFIGFSFWMADSSIMGIENLLFTVILALIVGVPLMNQIQPHVIVLRELYEVRESASNTYHWSVLMLSTILVEIPYNLTFTCLYYCCYYWPIGYDRSTARSGYFYFVFGVLYMLYYTTLGVAITTISADTATANVITSLIMNFVMSFCGVFQEPSLMPGFWKFMWRASPFTYFIEGMLSDVLHDKEVVCSDSELNFFDPPDGQTCYEYANRFIEEAGGYISNPNATASCGYCKWTVGDDFLETVDIDYDRDRWRSVGLIFVYLAFNVGITFVCYYIFRVMKWDFKLFKKVKK